MEGDSSFTPGQVEAILNALDINIISETRSGYLCLCPYHHNDSTPAFSISKDRGVFFCFSPACAQKGNLLKLVTDATDLPLLRAARFIAKYRGAEPELVDRVRSALKQAEPVSFDRDKIASMHEAALHSERAMSYFYGRGFTDDAIKTFRLGFSAKRDLVVVPMYDSVGNPVGVIGRSIEGKRFQNSRRLPSAYEWFNLNRAKRAGDEVIIVESSFDAIRVHQAGYPNVIAALGGYVSDAKVELVKNHFNSIVIATDNDKLKFWDDCVRCGEVCQGHNPGRDIGNVIVDKFAGMRISWASYDDHVIYPGDAKDISELTDEQISVVIDNRVSDYVYQGWNLY